MARKATHPPIVAKSGAISKGYNFTSTWEQNAPLSEQQQSAIAMLSHAVAERPFPVNLAEEHVVGQDNGLTIKTNEVFYGESEAIKAVLVNTNQFYKWFTDLESALKSETEEKYRHYVNTLTKRIQTCDDILKQTIHGDPNLRVSSLVWCRSDSAELPFGRLFSSSIDGSVSEWDLFHLKQKLSDGKTMNKLLMEAESRMTLFTGSSKVAEKQALDLKGRIKLEDVGFDWKVLGPDVHEVDYVAWTCDQDAYACSGQKCSAQSILFVHEPQL